MLTSSPATPTRRQRLLAALRETLGVRTAVERIPRRPGDPFHAPMSSGQQRLWLLNRLAPEDPVYNVPTCFRVRGELDRDSFTRALIEIVRRHEILRTTFSAPEGEPVQSIARDPDFQFREVDLSSLAGDESVGEAARLAREEARRSFDLAHGPLLRVALYRLAPDEHVVLIAMHHIVCDGWSMGVLFRELIALYGAISRGLPPSLPELPLQYADYAHWQQERVANGSLEPQLAYWKDQLRNAPASLELPLDHSRPRQPGFRGAMARRRFPAALSEGVRDLAASENATPFMLLLAAYTTLLARYTGQADLIVGCPVSNRTRLELEPLIGFLPNTIPMRVDLTGDPLFTELLSRVRRVASEAYSNAEAPFEEIAGLAGARSAGKGNPLFQVAFLCDETAVPQSSFADLEIVPMDLDLGSAKCDLTLSLARSTEGYSAALEYSTDLFEPETATRMLGHFETLLEDIVERPGRRLSELRLLPAAEQQCILVDWNRTDAPFALDHCAHEMFEQQAALHPDSPALHFGGRVVTYDELNRRANRLAHVLRRIGVGPDVIAAVAFRRSPDLIAAILGVLKAGGAYLPIALDHPAERIRFMLEDSRPPVVITAAGERGLDWAGHFTRFEIDDAALAVESDVNPGRAAGLGNLAYIIYTSGSTGRPKGVMVEHRGLSNLALAQQSLFELGCGRRVLQFAAPTFDASVWEIFMALASGACLCLGDGQELLPDELARVIRNQRVTTVTLPPSVLAVLSPDELPTLDTVISAGESCSETIAGRWGQSKRFFNAYGPTEATVCATAIRWTAGSGRPTIGRPIDNVKVHILDARMQPTPAGVAGEIHIGGVGLARGYLNRAELTSSRFVSDPFAAGRTRRLYKTGDRARYLANGEIEFLGRADDQVKIRGYRIELGEIESCLARHPDVVDCAVVAREDAGGARLIAYVVPLRRLPDAASLRGHLAASLPSYMIPSAFVTLDAMPLTTSGKIDRRALAAMETPVARKRTDARDELERDLTRIWQQVLHVPSVGVTDDFFELGGNSLSAVKVAAKIRKITGSDFPIPMLFEAGTIERVAAVIRNGRPPSVARLSGPRLVPLRETGTRPPLILIHPAGGSVFCYLELVRELGPDQPVHAIEAGRDAVRASSIQAMATAYLDLLEDTFLAGPCRLGGWSTGGLIAFEMARQLERRGGAVDAVLLLDTWATPAPEVPDDTDLLVGLASTHARLRGLNLVFDARRLRSMDEAGRIAAVADRLGDEAGAAEDLHAQLRMFRANIRAAQAYVPLPFTGPVLLVRASEPAGPKDRGWRPVAKRLQVRMVPGNHNSLLFEPHVNILAEAISGWGA